MKVYVLVVEEDSADAGSYMDINIYDSLEDAKAEYKRKVEEVKESIKDNSSFDIVEEKETAFRAYENGYYNSNHIEIWIEEKDVL